MANKEQKPFYKKWWFWLVIVIIVLFAVFSFGDEEDPVEDSNTGTEGVQDGTDSSDDTTGEDGTADKKSTEEATRDNASAKETTLNAGNFIVGEDIPAGRYVITGDGLGNIFVYNEEGKAEVNEILDESGVAGVKSVTASLEEGDEIEISRLNEVQFTPTETKLSTTLTTGNWVVGLDIEPGRYDVTTPDGTGNFVIYNVMGLPATNEILDVTGEVGVKKLTVTLEEGQEISISGVNEVEFAGR